MQTFFYYTNYHHTDKMVWKAIVYFLFVCDMFHSIICVYALPLGLALSLKPAMLMTRYLGHVTA